MTYINTGLIQANDLNKTIYGDNPTTPWQFGAFNTFMSFWGVGHGDYGYGMPAVYSPLGNGSGKEIKVVAGKWITTVEWVALQRAMFYAAMHQGSLSSLIGTPDNPSPVTSRVSNPVNRFTTIRYNYFDTVIGNLNMLVANRNNSVTGTSREIQPYKFQYTGGYIEFCKFTITIAFESGDKARWFFNQGGLIKVNFYHPTNGVPGSANDALSNLCSSIDGLYIAGSGGNIGGFPYSPLTVIYKNGNYNGDNNGYYALSSAKSPKGEDVYTNMAEWASSQGSGISVKGRTNGPQNIANGDNGSTITLVVTWDAIPDGTFINPLSTVNITILHPPTVGGGFHEFFNTKENGGAGAYPYVPPTYGKIGVNCSIFAPTAPPPLPPPSDGTFTFNKFFPAQDWANFNVYNYIKSFGWNERDIPYVEMFFEKGTTFSSNNPDIPAFTTASGGNDFPDDSILDFSFADANFQACGGKGGFGGSGYQSYPFCSPGEDGGTGGTAIALTYPCYFDLQKGTLWGGAGGGGGGGAGTNLGVADYGSGGGGGGGFFYGPGGKGGNTSNQYYSIQTGGNGGGGTRTQPGIGGAAYIGWGVGGAGGDGGPQPTNLWPADNQPGYPGITGAGHAYSPGGAGGQVGYALTGREYIILPLPVYHWGTATPTIPANIKVYGKINSLPGPPPAPTNIVATQTRDYNSVPMIGFKQVTVTVTPPVYDGPKIIQYIVEGLPTIPGLSSPYQVISKTNIILINGLTNGTTYKFRVKVKTRTSDESPWSIYSNNIIPIWKPQPPTAVTASQAPAVPLTARITWVNPIDTGGLPLTRWTITALPDNIVIEIVSSSPIVTTDFSGLTRGSAYTFTIQTWNTEGVSLPSTPSSSIRVYEAPGPVLGVTAFRNPNGSVTISWTMPADNGGTPILTYSVYNTTGTPGQFRRTVGFPTSSATLTGLPAGSYRFGVYATNNQGDGPVIQSNTVQV